MCLVRPAADTRDAHVADAADAKAVNSDPRTPRKEAEKPSQFRGAPIDLEAMKWVRLESLPWDWLAVYRLDAFPLYQRYHIAKPRLRRARTGEDYEFDVPLGIGTIEGEARVGKFL